MSLSPNRANKYDQIMQKENYQRHLDRLDKLKGKKGSDQVKRDEDQKKLVYMMTNLRKIHKNHRSYQIKQMRNKQKSFNSQNFHKVKSVVKDQFERDSLVLAPKYKITLSPIDEQNQKLYERLKKVKSNIHISQMATMCRWRRNSSNKQFLAKTQRQAQLNIKKQKYSQFKLKLGKCKKNIKIMITFSFEELKQIFNSFSDYLYIFKVNFMEYSAKSRLFFLEEYKSAQLQLKIPSQSHAEEQIQIQIYRVSEGNKQIFKGAFKVTKEQIIQCCKKSKHRNEEDHSIILLSSISKPVLNFKGKQQGKISLKCKIYEHTKLSYSPQRLLTEIHNTSKMI